MGKYVDGFNQMFEEVAEASNVEVRERSNEPREFPDSIVERHVDYIRKETGFELAGELRACMNASNGTRLWWFYRISDARTGGGEFHLRHLMEVFTYGPPELWTDETPSEEVAFLKKLRVIDQRPNAGDNKFAAFKLEPGQMPPEIWYYDRGDYFRMDITYPEYLEALMDTKGVTDWQYLFCTVDLTAPLRVGLDDKLEKRLNDLETLFPDRDYSAYQERLDQMRHA